jgi:uncharacterized protein YdiU (UPF0061 family)
MLISVLSLNIDYGPFGFVDAYRQRVCGSGT